MSGSGDVSLTIFIISVSDGESLTSFTSCFFHFSRPPGFRLALMRRKVMENLVAFSVKEVKRAAAEKRERDEYFSAEDSENRSKKQIHPSKLSEN